MNSNTNNVKISSGKGITLVSFGIMTLVAAIAGATFAFFQATASAEISGGSAYSNDPLELTIVHETQTAVGNKKLIPQYDSNIQAAITGGTNGPCVDSSGQAVCKVYSIKVTNKTSTNYYLDGQLSFATKNGKSPVTTTIYDSNTGEYNKVSSTTMPNLKWALGTSPTAGFPANGEFYSSFNTSSSATQTVSLSDPFYLGKSTTSATTDEKIFYVAVWISETGEVQNDNGEFTGTVTFTGYSDDNKNIQGVTSTIRG